MSTNLSDLAKTLSSLASKLNDNYNKMGSFILFSKYPEVESVTIRCTHEYNDQGGTNPYLSVSSMKLSPEGMIEWLGKYDEDALLEGDMEGYEDDYDFVDYVSEQMGIPYDYFDPNLFDKYDSEETYTNRGTDINQEYVSNLMSSIQGMIPLSNTSSKVYVVLYRATEYNDEGYFYTEGYYVDSVYLNKADAVKRKEEMESSNKNLDNDGYAYDDEDLDVDVSIQEFQLK